MSRRKKKEHHEEHMDESWLIPYADLLTLLLALFIVLFAMSSVDAVKFQALSKAFNEVFSGGTGVFEFQSPTPDGQMESPDEQKKMFRRMMFKQWQKIKKSYMLFKRK